MDTLLSQLSFRALWTPELALNLLAVALIYIWFARKKGRPILFLLGLIALYIGWGSPLYVAGHVMMTVHMIQMVFSYFVAVPLLLLGIPKSWYIWLDDKLPARNIRRLLWNPIVALVLFNGLFSFYHVPTIFDTLMQAPALHSAYQWLLLGASALMWWFMLAPLPNGYKLRELRRILYIFLNGVLITPACALIIFAPDAMYATYTDPLIWSQVMTFCLPGIASADALLSMFGGPKTLGFFDAHIDQQLAGALMKVFQEIVYGATMGYVFKQWLKKEKLQDGEVTISDIPPF